MPEEWIALLRDMDRRVSDLSARVDLADANIRADLTLLRADIRRLESLEPETVKRVEFAPVRALTFGFASLVLVAVVTALVSLVVR